MRGRVPAAAGAERPPERSPEIRLGRHVDFARVRDARREPLESPRPRRGYTARRSKQPISMPQNLADMPQVQQELGTPPRTFQDLIFALQKYWADQGCVILQPYDMEMGAGTF